MRRTKHRRRFHTDRIVSNRQRRARGLGFFHEDGRCDSVDPYFGCPRPRCHICHWDKLDPSRRARERRSWRGWETEYE